MQKKRKTQNKIKRSRQKLDVIDIRVLKSKEKVLLAATEILYEYGLTATSVDEISRRSGVAKTTIYRHWPTRTDLVHDACLLIGTPIPDPDTGDSITDILFFLKHLAKILKTEKWTSVLPSVIDAAERDSNISKMYKKIQSGYSAPLGELIRRGIKKGDLSRSVDVDLVVSALTGPLFFRRWFSREPLTDFFVEYIVQTVLGKKVEYIHNSKQERNRPNTRN